MEKLVRILVVVGLYSCSVEGMYKVQTKAQDKVEHERLVKEANNDKNCPLLEALLDLGDFEEAEILIEKGVGINEGADIKPLHAAAYLGNAKIIELLVKAHATIDARTKIRMTPLHVAALAGQAESIEPLLRAGAKKDALSLENFTPFLLAAWMGNAKVVELLFNAGANKEALGKDGFTHIFWATASGNLETVEVLLSNNVAFDATMKKEVRPLRVCSCSRKC